MDMFLTLAGIALIVLAFGFMLHGNPIISIKINS